MSAIPSVILAGGALPTEVALEIGGINCSLALFCGRPLMSYVVDAVRGHDRAGTVCVVGPAPDSDLYERVPDQGDFVANLLAGLRKAGGAEWALVGSGDMPFITEAVVAQFLDAALERARQEKTIAVYPIVPRALCYRRYPGILRTAVRTREGEFTGGNLFLVRPDLLLSRAEIIARAYAARKQPFRLAQMLGLSILVRLVLSQVGVRRLLPVALLERKIGSLIDGDVAAVVCELPELATDLDRPSDFRAAEQFVMEKA